MKKEIAQTASWLWGIVRNPDVVWVDVDTGAELSEYWKRIDRFHILRPMWMYTFLTTEADCGCRKRFGLWRVIICSEHTGFWDNEDEDDDEA